MIVVAVIGMLAALAIPNYIRFQARSKQSEVKANLKAAFTTERAYYQEHNTYTSCTMKIGFAPERGNRYRYTLNTTRRADENCNTSEDRSTGAGINLPTDGEILVDSFKHGTGAGVTAANAAAPAPTYTAVVPFGTTLTVQNDLVGVVPNIADADRELRGSGARGHRQRRPAGPLVPLQRLVDHRGRVSCAGRAGLRRCQAASRRTPTTT